MRAVTVALMAQLVLAALAPVPASAQPAACAGGRQFVVYFPANLALIPPQGGQGVVAAAASYAANGPHRLMLTGHADAVEADVSAARADATKAALLSLGVNAAQIAVTSVGSTRPAVASDGAQPLNRRVDICVAPAG